MFNALNKIITADRIYFFVNVIIWYNNNTGCWGTVSHTLLKGGGMMTIFEAMYLMIAFATLIVLIIKKK